MRRIVIVDYGKQSEKIAPKYYPWIWLALVVSILFGGVYGLYNNYAGVDLKPASLLTSLAIDILIMGVVPVVFYYVVASIFYRRLAKKGMLDIPRKDFIYFTLLFMAGAEFVLGLIKVFNFVEPTLDLFTLLYTDVIITTVALYLEFFLVLWPKYLNPVQARAHFNVLSKGYTILIAILSVLVLGGLFVMIEGLEVILEEGGNSSAVGGVTVTVGGEELTPSQVRQLLLMFKGPFSIVAYITAGAGAAVVITHLVLSAWLKKKAAAYRIANPSEFAPKQDTTIYYSGNPFDNMSGGNPFADKNKPNSFAGDNPFSDDFGKNEGNPFGDDYDNSKDDNPFDELK